MFYIIATSVITCVLCSCCWCAGVWPLFACPSENLVPLLNGLNTICLAVMALMRLQPKSDVHDNAAKNIQSLIVTVEFLLDEMS